MSTPGPQVMERGPLIGCRTASKLRVPRELEIALNAPIGPQRIADDTIVTDEGGWYRTLTPSFPSATYNEVLFSDLTERDAERQLEGVISEYTARGLPFVWCVYSWTRPVNLGDRLIGRGAKQSTIVALLRSTSLAPDIAEGVEIEHIDPSTASYGTYVDAMSTGYDLPPVEKAFRYRHYHRLCSGPEPLMHLFLARHNGVVAGCQALIIKGDSGHLTGAYVVPAFRAYGVFQSLIAACLTTLHDMGIAIATGHSNQQSAFWAKRFGFKAIYSYDMYQLDPPPAVG